MGDNSELRFEIGHYPRSHVSEAVLWLVFFIGVLLLGWREAKISYSASSASAVVGIAILAWPVWLVTALGTYVIIQIVSRKAGQSAVLRVQQTQIVIDGIRPIARAAIVSGGMEALEGGKACVSLDVRAQISNFPTFGQKKVVFLMDGEGDARMLLSSLGIAAESGASTETFHFLDGRAVLTAIFVLLSCGALSLTTGSLRETVILSFVIAVALVAALLRVNVSVGTDGVRVSSATQKYFLSFRDIAGVRWTKSDIHLDRGDGSITRLRIDALRQIDFSPSRPSRRLAQRIQQAFEASRESLPVTLELHRDGRTGGEWLNVLRGAAGSGYRAAALSTQALGRAIESSLSDPETRVAAAVVLASAVPSVAITQITEAGDKSVNPRIRIAFRRIADGSSDREIEECLDEFIASEEEEQVVVRTRATKR